jgi:sulfoxide reductase heme-binding subunit YedZ
VPIINRWIQSHLTVLKTLLFVLCLLPLLSLLLGAFAVAGFSLGANPIEKMIHQLGLWGLRFLLITLAISPIRQLTGLLALTRMRRMLGLFAFFYVLMHFVSYAVLDQSLLLSAIIEDIIERPYITLGITALVLMTPLAITSTNAMMRRLGRRWQQLHLLIYPIAILAVWHFYWQVKKDLLEPLVYAGILLLLLAFRGWKKYGSRRR